MQSDRHATMRLSPIIESTKEQLILESAEREFLQKGFEGARTTSIAKAAGVNHAMLHYYFRTKELLFKKILDQKMQLMDRLILSAFGDSQLPLVDRIRKGVADHYDFIAANPDLPRFLVNEVFTHPDRYTLMQEKLKSTLGKILPNLQKELDEASARGEIEPMDVRMLLLDIISLNAFQFIAQPIFEPIMGDLTEDRQRFLEARKKENIEIIMRRIKRLNR